MKKKLQQKLLIINRIIVKSSISRYVILVLIIGVIPFLVYGGFLSIFRGRIYPRVSIIDLEVGGQRFGEVVAAVDVLERDFLAKKQLSIKVPENENFTSSISTVLTFESINLKYEARKTAGEAYSIGRGGDFITNFWSQIKAIQENVTLAHIYSYDEDRYKLWLEEVSENYSNQGAQPTVSVNEVSQLQIFPGEDGLVVDTEKLNETIKMALGSLDSKEIAVELKRETNKISLKQEEQAKRRAEAIINKTLEISFSDTVKEQNWTLRGAELVGFIDLRGGFRTEALGYYLDSISDSINRPAQNALFTFKEERVTEFAPGLNGVQLNKNASIEKFKVALLELEQAESVVPVELVIEETEPDIRTSEVNDLGIHDLLGTGFSTYKGSIPGRVHNVALTASRLHGVLIPPKETFSFNETVGEVSSKTGYKSAYVISGGRTVLGDGGGVCQDSTTLFRAVMDAGLPVVHRKAHSYRVGYYEQNEKPGFDATVYSPSVDFKFENDTSGYVLIQAYADSTNLSLTIELYGTDDGRVSEITNYQQWGAIPAPPPLYQDDPSLAPGQEKQIDWAAPGLNVKFDYRVTRNEEVLFEKTFHSNYRPWQAVYLRGV